MKIQALCVKTYTTEMNVIFKRLATFFTIFLVFILFTPSRSSAQENSLAANSHPINKLVGEKLLYDISFLWFDRLAEGTISLQSGPDMDTYLVVMEARTLGVAAFFTGNRVERFESLDASRQRGALLPVTHSSHTIRDKKGKRRERIKHYYYDYTLHKVRRQEIKDGQIKKEHWYDLDPQKPLFDILSALYNLRLGYFGPVGNRTLQIPTFHRKGPQAIVIEPIKELKSSERRYMQGSAHVARILVDPEVFGTNGREIIASFDANMLPFRGIIKDVIGLGDVKGQLRQISSSIHMKE